MLILFGLQFVIFLTAMKLPISRNKDVVVQELGDEVLIYDLIMNKAYCLNETAKLVFDLCDGCRNVTEISQMMSQKLKTSVHEDLIELTINDLRKNKLLEESMPPVSLLTGATRREMIKRVGLASMIALPMISSVVAPTAATAASGTPCLAPGTMVTLPPQPTGNECLILGLADSMQCCFGSYDNLTYSNTTQACSYRC